MLQESRSSRRVIWISAIVFAVLSIASAISSHGFLEADGCTHFMMARFSLSEPTYLVSVWGRPLVTAVYALPASLPSQRLALIGTRLMSLVMVLGMAGITYAIAKKQGYRRPELAFLFLLAEPLLFLHSFAVLTEVPFALLLAAGFWAYQCRKFGWMALAAALLPLARPEGFGFLLLAFAALILHRRWRWLILLPIPLLLWNTAGWVLYGRQDAWWRWLIDQWPYAADSLYHSGHLWHFLVRLPVIISPLLFPAMWIGIVLELVSKPPKSTLALSKTGVLEVLKRLLMLVKHLGATGRGTPRPVAARHVHTHRSASTPTCGTRALFPPSHPQCCQWLIAILPLGILAVHSLLYWLGKMASNGEMRYLLIVAPFWALLTARGWSWTFDRLDWRRPALWGGLAALAPLLAQAAYPIVPLTVSPDWQMASCIARQVQDLKIKHPNLMAAHPGVWYALDRSPSGPHTYEWSRRRMEHPPAGTILIWDSVYGVYNSDQDRSITADDLIAAGWRPDEALTQQCRAQAVKALPPGQGAYIGRWEVFFSPR